VPRHIICAAIVLSLTWTGASAQETDTRPEAPDKIEMSAAELFAFADAARDRGELELAEKAYRALARDPELELRVEARFRLGMMLADRMGKYREAAVEFRAILDEKPDAAGVRLQLARMQAQLGDLAAARKELRAARASNLPPEVDQMVRFYANALESMKRSGGSFEFALAPSNNINRATNSDTLGTVIGDFTLDEDAKARSCACWLAALALSCVCAACACSRFSLARCASASPGAAMAGAAISASSAPTGADMRIAIMTSFLALGAGIQALPYWQALRSPARQAATSRRQSAIACS